jgi:4-amino-4-deoxy-L-arabinose transferase-like glycosyltransferase
MGVWAPYVLALFFALWGLRGVSRTDVVYADAARHAMNGVFVYDMVRGGHITHPIAYAMEYYGHLPSLSMPYHPPLFPVLESVFFAVFGVKLLSARLAVACAVGICTVLLYRLVQATLGNDALAACVTVTMLSLRYAQIVAGEVMLEFPAMAFALAALYCLRDMEQDFPLGRALLFTAFAAAAVWTKQTTVFLGAVPVICALFARRRILLRRKEIWISLALFGTAAIGLAALSLPFGNAGVNLLAKPQPQYTRWIFLSTIPFYCQWSARHLIGLPGVFAACSIAAYAWAAYTRGWQKLGLNLYIAWIVSVCAVLLVLRDHEPRYLFFVFPALIVVGYALLFQGCSHLWGERRAWYVPAGFAVAWFAVGLHFQPLFLRGPGEAAALVMHGAPVRVVYAGELGGNFTFSVRSLDPKLQSTVILGMKLPDDTFEPVAFETFCRKYGVNWIALEEGPETYPWYGLFKAPATSMKMERSIPLECYLCDQSGKINLYRFTAPGAPSGEVLEIPIKKIRGTIKVKL